MDTTSLYNLSYSLLEASQARFVDKLGQRHGVSTGFSQPTTADRLGSNFTLFDDLLSIEKSSSSARKGVIDIIDELNAIKKELGEGASPSSEDFVQKWNAKAEQFASLVAELEVQAGSVGTNPLEQMIHINVVETAKAGHNLFTLLDPSELDSDALQQGIDQTIGVVQSMGANINAIDNELSKSTRGVSMMNTRLNNSALFLGNYKKSAPSVASLASLSSTFAPGLPNLLGISRYAGRLIDTDI